MADWLSAGANLIGSFLSSAGSVYANRMSRKSARHAQNRNFKFAREQTDKLIDLANSAHQREVADLRAAGLNPILSAGGSGASTPSLPMATADAPTVENPLVSAASSAREIGRLISQEYKADLENKEKSAQLNEANAKSQSLQNNLDSSLAPLKKEVQTTELLNDYMRSVVDRKAVEWEYGLNPAYSSDGGVTVLGYKIKDPESFVDAVELAREGLRSDLKIRSNANWRANLSSFVPFVSPAAINSAGSAARRFRSLFK